MTTVSQVVLLEGWVVILSVFCLAYKVTSVPCSHSVGISRHVVVTAVSVEVSPGWHAVLQARVKVNLTAPGEISVEENILFTSY